MPRRSRFRKAQQLDSSAIAKFQNFCVALLDEFAQKHTRDRCIKFAKNLRKKEIVIQIKKLLLDDEHYAQKNVYERIKEEKLDNAMFYDAIKDGLIFRVETKGICCCKCQNLELAEDWYNNTMEEDKESRRRKEKEEYNEVFTYDARYGDDYC